MAASASASSASATQGLQVDVRKIRNQLEALQVRIGGDCRDEKKHVAVLMLSGSLSPIHNGHVGMMELARLVLQRRGIEVVGGFLAPSSDSYVGGKLGSDALSLTTRVRLTGVAVEESDWLEVIPWGWANSYRIAQKLHDLLSVDLRSSLEEVAASLDVVEIVGADFALRAQKWRAFMRLREGGGSSVGRSLRSIVCIGRGEETEGVREEIGDALCPVARLHIPASTPLSLISYAVALRRGPGYGALPGTKADGPEETTKFSQNTSVLPTNDAEIRGETRYPVGHLSRTAGQSSGGGVQVGGSGDGAGEPKGHSEGLVEVLVEVLQGGGEGSVHQAERQAFTFVTLGGSQQRIGEKGKSAGTTGWDVSSTLIRNALKAEGSASSFQNTANGALFSVTGADGSGACSAWSAGLAALVAEGILHPGVATALLHSK